MQAAEAIVHGVSSNKNSSKLRRIRNNLLWLIGPRARQTEQRQSLTMSSLSPKYQCQNAKCARLHVHPPARPSRHAPERTPAPTPRSYALYAKYHTHCTSHATFPVPPSPDKTDIPQNLARLPHAPSPPFLFTGYQEWGADCHAPLCCAAPARTYITLALVSPFGIQLNFCGSCCC